jgi:hypothetical protein
LQWRNDEAISCLFVWGFFGGFFCFSFLRQFKIVNPTRQPGEKTTKLCKSKLPLHVVWMSNVTKTLIYFIYEQKKY